MNFRDKIPYTWPACQVSIHLRGTIGKEWLEDGSGRWDEYTYWRYESILRLHVWPHNCFKGKRVDQISRKDVKACLRTLLQEKLSPATVELCHTVLNGIFKEAIEERYIDGNPATGLLKKLLPPKNKRDVNESDPFDMEEKKRFLEHAEKISSWPEQLILKTMVYTGFRLGETLAIRIRHLDMKKMTYHPESSRRHKTLSVSR